VIERPLAPGSDRLRVLFVAKRFPYPADTGGKIRTARLLEQLSRRLDITLISNVEHPKDDPYLAQVDKLCTVESGGLVRAARQPGSTRVIRRSSRYPVSVPGSSRRSPSASARVSRAAMTARLRLRAAHIISTTGSASRSSCSSTTSSRYSSATR
jgi:hypothetical protein